MKSATLPSLRVEPAFTRRRKTICFLVPTTLSKLGLALSAIAAIRSGIESLSRHPFSYRKHDKNPLLRELIIPLGASGHVALYRILDESPVLVLAVRQQLESDYH